MKARYVDVALHYVVRALYRVERFASRSGLHVYARLTARDPELPNEIARARAALASDTFPHDRDPRERLVEMAATTPGWEPLARPCPTCGVKAGYPCPGGHPAAARPYFHPSRRAASVPLPVQPQGEEP